MPLIKVTDLAYGRLRSPDLDLAEEFLTHFGMVRSERTENALYMRGTDPAHHVHVTEKGEPGFVGLAYYAASMDDLKRLAKHFELALEKAELRFTKVIDGELGMRHRKDHIYKSTCMMFDQRELTLPVERTFQNQRPGSSSSLACAARTCTVSI